MPKTETKKLTISEVFDLFEKTPDTEVPLQKHQIPVDTLNPRRGYRMVRPFPAVMRQEPDGTFTISPEKGTGILWMFNGPDQKSVEVALARRGVKFLRILKRKPPPELNSLGKEGLRRLKHYIVPVRKLTA